jgi:hypothetical protein
MYKNFQNDPLSNDQGSELQYTFLAQLNACCPSVCIYMFSTGSILTRLGTNHPWEQEILIVQMKVNAPAQGQIIAKE